MKSPKNHQKFYCEKCDYSCNRLSEWKRHCSTAKHKNWTKLDNIGQKITEKNTTLYRCECGKVYKARSTFYYHKKKCNYHAEDDETDEIIVKDNDDPSYKELLIQAMKEMTEMRKENTEMRKQMTDMIPLIGNTTTNNNNTTNNFNLNFFLNEQCKDALNLTDFINSLQLQLNDLEYTADKGHIKGITNIFHNALNNMEVTKRPLHCTDLKREVLYIKDNDEWHKDEDKEEIKSAVDKVVNKNLGNTGKWLNKYPNHCNTESSDFDNYIKMTANSLGTGEDTEKNKIVKNILKEVVIDKDLKN